MCTERKIAKSNNLIGQECNIASNSEISIGDLAQKIIELINPDAVIKEDKQRLRPDKSEVFRLVGSNEKIIRNTNWRTKYSLTEGLIETIEWFKNPGISPDVALYIRSKFPNIRCIGIDSISVSSYSNRELGRKTHQIFLNTDKDLSEPILLLEDVDLSNDNACRLKTVIICPLLIENVDSSPCTIIGMY